MRRSMNVGVALGGLLVVAAISVAAGSGRKPTAAENAATTVRILSNSEAAQIGRTFPGLRVRSQVGSELLERLFPNTSFYGALYPGRPPYPYLISINGDSELMMPAGFNRLLRHYGTKVTSDNIVDLAKAFVILAVVNEPTTLEEGAAPNDSPQIVFLRGQRTDDHDSSNADAIDARIVCRIGSGEVETWEFSQSRHTPRKGVWVKVGQFGVVYRVINGKRVREYAPVEAEEETRRGMVIGNPEVVVVADTAGNATVEQDTFFFKYHYYLRTYRNAAPTGYWVRFRLHNLDSCEQNVYIRVAPKDTYSYGPDTLLGPISIDGGGNGVSDWTPPPGTRTGIAKVCAGNKAPGDTFVRRTSAGDDKELTLEKTVTTPFPSASGDSLTIYYCSQFFVHHHQPSDAEDFARYVDSAMMKAWQMQVNTWQLGASSDPDRNHEVFIVDSVHWYHTVPLTWTEPGPSRKIGLLSWQRFVNDAHKAYSSESIMVYSVLAHEFFHGIQRTLDVAKYEADPWNWFTEAQARFMQSAQYPDEEFGTSDTWGYREYARDANKYLTQYLNTSLSWFSNYPIGGYPYCLFWRFMYENFGQNSDAIRLVRDCYAENVGTSNSIGRGKAAIDAAMVKSPVFPGWANFSQTLDQFAVACYLNDDTSFHRWNPNPPGVYSRPQFTYGTDTAFRVGPNETDTIGFTDSIPHSFGIDLMQVMLQGRGTLPILIDIPPGCDAMLVHVSDSPCRGGWSAAPRHPARKQPQSGLL
jgi:hypothetical protein